jgi:hypothetical protein
VGSESLTPAAPTPLGAYGLRLENVRRARDLLNPADLSWPALRIRRKVGFAEAEHDWMNDSAARLNLQNGGQIGIDRARGEAVFTVPHKVGTAEIVHPLLAPVAAVMAYWLDRESFHAGAFVVAGKAWAVLGERGGGKSTTIAGLALEDVPIVCDDLLVLDGLRSFRAPRSVDLRRTAAKGLGVGTPLGVVGARERWRLNVRQLEGDYELGGWVFLNWGDQLEASRLRPSERLLRLTACRGTRLPPRSQDALLELASLPAWELTRPKRWSSLPQTVDWLRNRLG